MDCTEKLSFNNEAAAVGAKVYAEHQHGTKLKVYRCKTCQNWHLSSV